MIAGIMNTDHPLDVTMSTDDPRCANSLGYVSGGATEHLVLYYAVRPGTLLAGVMF
jgi:hypothetical protein